MADFKRELSDNANNDINNKEDNKLSIVQKEAFIKKIAQKNPEFFSSTTINPFVKNPNSGKVMLNPKLENNKSLL